MPTLYLREYSSMASAAFLGGPAASGLPCPVEPCLAQQRITVLDENSLSAPFAANTKFVRVASDTACLIDIGSMPDAAKRGSLMPPGVEFFGVADGHKLSVVQT